MIADIDYYNSQGFDNPAGDDKLLEKALARAERLIDLITGGKCNEYDALSEQARDRLRYAVSAQAENYLINGFDNGGAIDHKVKIGDFSYESRNNGIIQSVSPVAMASLKLSGLLYAGTEVR
ncbi:MAG: hypothetical protein FWH08_03165 [Oscillospiraceae bacterium]|nr:hypothetical protein [Oscillospiraceae bacterium]